LAESGCRWRYGGILPAHQPAMAATFNKGRHWGLSFERVAGFGIAIWQPRPAGHDHGYIYWLPGTPF
jgi:hypothetical protein